jgi:hypothetical protein
MTLNMGQSETAPELAAAEPAAAEPAAAEPAAAEPAAAEPAAAEPAAAEPAEEEEVDAPTLSREELDELRDRMVLLQMDIDGKKAEKEAAVKAYNNKINAMVAEVSEVAQEIRDALYENAILKIKRKAKRKKAVEPDIADPPPDLPETFTLLEVGQVYRIRLADEPGALRDIVRVLAVGDCWVEIDNLGQTERLSRKQWNNRCAEAVPAPAVSVGQRWRWETEPATEAVVLGNVTEAAVDVLWADGAKGSCPLLRFADAVLLSECTREIPSAPPLGAVDQPLTEPLPDVDTLMIEGASPELIF